MSSSFTNQVMAQIELFGNTSKYEKKVYVPAQVARREGGAAASRQARRALDDAVAGAGIVHRRSGRGPYKPDHYRY